MSIRFGCDSEAVAHNNKKISCILLRYAPNYILPVFNLEQYTDTHTPISQHECLHNNKIYL